ncbi:MAG: helix-turn-helix domain-containing protein [Gammaproteobacteria bacterium]|jgi:DNA-binding transcriptional ArsR family regulator|nr:helix-turn-helix domain-containing protein [Gammaproteobacteria bacterium]MDH3848179.1 helix-turn-helix domain-containing protein [Gammaproteobacteria bacterium]MDH3862719.1 helix-turn-helix domain-containing protein [Gammaproteobacteria bacterium]MDH3905894.1 helix-turn-helix domain-containing protein [Gammaproteobacteria bacterium]MDH3953554.1 helix-turn-helix domain-containing protein [Gammaproteobacteria bacterium]
MDATFKALADPTRRALLDRLLGKQGQTLTELVDGLGMRRQSVAKHLAILEGAGLVSCQWHGREKLHYLNTVPIAEISRRWLDRFSGQRAAAILNLRDALQENENE